MKILWAKTDYLHPTTRGGQIRTLEMLRCLHARHEIHYVCLDDGTSAEGPAGSCEYCSRAYAVPHSVPPRRSLHFAGQLAKGLHSELPVSLARYRSEGMKQKLRELLASQQFDAVVCDFLSPALNMPDLSRAILFQHNVEALIWKRHAEQANNLLTRAYLQMQAARMERYERDVCTRAARVIAVSDVDRDIFQREYGVESVDSVQTGVNVDYFTPPRAFEKKADFVFLGSMDWLPNVDGALFFIDQIYPRIRERVPDARVVFAGRRPDPSIEHAVKQHPNLTLTGTVPDVRPWLWGSSVSIVPLRIGGGTRLKIFEAMAARIPVVSTSVGAEGLPVENGGHLLVADDAVEFANACIDLLRNPVKRQMLADEAWTLVSGRFSWDAVTKDFEHILESQAALNAQSNSAVFAS